MDSKFLKGDLHCNVVMLIQMVSWQLENPNLNTAVREYGTNSRGACTKTLKEPVIADGTRNNGTNVPRIVLTIWDCTPSADKFMIAKIRNATIDLILVNAE